MSSVEDKGENDTPFIETQFQDILTGSSCSALLAELIKYILYQKQQLPYTFDHLKYLVTSKKVAETSTSHTKSNSASVSRLYKTAENGLNILETLFEKTRQELIDSSKGKIKEIALILGGTPLTPKQVYRIHLPDVDLGHLPANHPERRNMQYLLQSLLHSSKLTDMLMKPLGPTNMFVFIRKIADEENISKWFLPKNKYKIPSAGQHFNILFKHPNLGALSCPCSGFEIYTDNPEIKNDSRKGFSKFTKLPSESQDTDLSDDNTIWYQACTIFKGFKDVYVNGTSASDLWH